MDRVYSGQVFTLLIFSIFCALSTLKPDFVDERRHCGPDYRVVSVFFSADFGVQVKPYKTRVLALYTTWTICDFRCTKAKAEKSRPVVVHRFSRL